MPLKEDYVLHKWKGPYETKPEIEPAQDVCQTTSKVALELLVAKDKMHVTFEPVILAEYGTLAGGKNDSHLALTAKGRIDIQEIWKLGSRTLAKLAAKRGMIGVNEHLYAGMANDCAVEFTLQRGLFYPAVRIKVLGKKDAPLDLLREIGTYDIGEQFPPGTREIGIIDSTQHGLAYGFQINGKPIKEILSAGNVVL